MHRICIDNFNTIFSMRTRCVFDVCALTALMFFGFVGGSKLRSWLGSGMFIEGPKPAGRAIGQNLAELRGKIYVFGGTAGSNYLNDLHVFQPQTRTWADLSTFVLGNPPAPRYGHAFISMNDKLVVFGGRSTDGNFLIQILHQLVSPRLH